MSLGKLGNCNLSMEIALSVKLMDEVLVKEISVSLGAVWQRLKRIINSKAPMKANKVYRFISFKSICLC